MRDTVRWIDAWRRLDGRRERTKRQYRPHSVARIGVRRVRRGVVVPPRSAKTNLAVFPAAIGLLAVPISSRPIIPLTTYSERNSVLTSVANFNVPRIRIDLNSVLISESTVTVIPIGMSTRSSVEGRDPPHVAVAVQSPLVVAVIVAVPAT